jgi:hypothetical protein
MSLLSAVAISITGTGLAKTDNRPAASSTVWRSNPAYANQLAAPVKVDEFYIKPPVGYTLELNNSKYVKDGDVGDQYKWRGPAGPDGTRPSLDVVVFHVKPGFTNTLGATEHLNLGLDGMNGSNKHYIHTDTQNGTISGQNFVRAYWKRDPSDTNAGKRYHGFQYSYAQSKIFVSILGEDVEPHYKSTLDLLEASALTFHK